jgi:DNA-binding NarL/FixJ family response regulator
MATGTRMIPTSATSEAAQATIAAVNRSPLTPREMDVLRLMADGLTTRAIATQLGMRFKTAACHRNRILQKLAVKSTVSAVRWAIRAGLIAV